PRAPPVVPGGGRPPSNAGDLCHEVEVFVRCAAPVLIDLADQVLGGTAPHAIGEPALATGVRARRLPVVAFAGGELAPAGRTPVRVG
ncbi:hypothetical protein K1W54_07310, partial [Micromonospora sp. CPCC 205371]|nr:hypothetical protein [Micromonospora sp. CPCC 205371]